MLRVLGTTTEKTLHRAFVSGCLIDPDLKVVDILNERHAICHFSDQPVENFLKALRHTREQLFVLRHLLQSLIGNGDLASDKVAAWTGYCTGQTSEGAPSIILSKDLVLVMACLDIVRRRIDVENGMLSNSGHLRPTAPQVNMVAQTLVLHPKAPLPRDTSKKKQSVESWPPNLHRDTKHD